MDEMVVSTSSSAEARCLSRLQVLAAEIQAGMDSIAANDLLTLQASIAKQEGSAAELAVELASLRCELQAKRPARDVSRGAACMGEVGSAAAALRQLNLQYSSLLRHSGRSIALLASLCSSQLGQFGRSGVTTSRHQTWSCEM